MTLYPDAVDYDWIKRASRTDNRFCPTGPGGGVDPSCGSTAHADALVAKHGAEHSKFKSELATAELRHNEAVMNAMMAPLADRAQARRELTAATAEYVKAGMAFEDHLEKAREAVPAAPNPSRVSLHVDGPAFDTSAAEDAAKFVGRLTGGGHTLDLRVRQTADARSGYNSLDGTLRLADPGLQRVAVHEIGHAVEEKLGKVAAAEAFINRRCKDEEPVELRNLFGKAFHEGEMGRKDSFGKAFGSREYYVGKTYHDVTGNVVATEAVSMGLEALHSDPVGFAKADPDYYNWLLETLHGNR